MPLVRVFFLPMSGVHAFAPRLGNPARGLRRPHGHHRKYSSPRTALGASLRLSHQSRHRVGLNTPARTHSRYQCQRNVHRIRGPALDWRGIYRTSATRADGRGQLLRQARGAGPRNGRQCFFFGAPTRTLSTVDRAPFAHAVRPLTVYSPA